MTSPNWSDLAVGGHDSWADNDRAVDPGVEYADWSDRDRDGFAAWGDLDRPAGTGAPLVTTTSLPAGTLAEAWTATLTATGTGPIVWSIASGALPSWAALVPSTGQIAGTPTATGTSTFGVRATGPAGYDDQELTIVVEGEGDGELPIEEPAPPPVVAAPERTPPRVQILVAALDMVDEAGAALPTKLFCRGAGWTTWPDDSPAHSYVDGRILAGGSYSSSMFAGSEMCGAMQVSFGQLDLANQASHSLDAWRTYGFDSRKCELFIGYRGEPFPTGFTRVISTEMKRVEVATDRIRVMLRDPMEALKRPVLRARFAGTGGLEGDAALAGQPRPRAIGTTFFTPMVLVDQARWIYFVCDEPSAPSGVVVYDGGAAVTQGAAYSSTADLLATAPATGQARVFTAGPTYVRFAAAPAYEPTMTRFGVGGGDTARNLIAELGIAAHPTHRTGPGFGAYVDSLSVSYAQVMTEAYRQRPYFFGVDGDRRFVSRAVVDPAGETPTVVIGARDILRISRTTPDGLEVPVWRVVVRGNRNNSKGGTLAAAAVAAAHRRYGNASVAENPATLVKHPTAGELAFEIGGDPVGMAGLHLALHGVHRDWFSVVLPMIPQWAGLAEGDVIRVVYHRFDLAGGRNFVIAARTVDFGAGEFTFGLWG